MSDTPDEILNFQAMENIILSRAILFGVFVIHLFIGYAIKTVKHVNSKFLDTAFALEMFVLTTFVVYDNIQSPPYNGWALAISGYLLLYGLIVLEWWAYGAKTIENDKVYELKQVMPAHFHLPPDTYYKSGASGFIRQGWHKFHVVVYGENAFKKAVYHKPFKVRLKNRQEDLPLKFDFVMKDVSSEES